LFLIDLVYQMTLLTNFIPAAWTPLYKFIIIIVVVVVIIIIIITTTTTTTTTINSVR
jgi:hypothetical protein